MKTRKSNLTSTHLINRSGFSLVELMIVLAILVLLAGLVLPRLLGSQKKADIQTTMTQIANFKQTLEMYSVDNRSFPKTEEGLKALVSKPEDENRSRNWDGPYMDELPIDPWGSTYNYEYPPTNGSKDFPNIWSNGPDGENGTDDDIKNWSSDSQSDEESMSSGGDELTI